MRFGENTANAFTKVVCVGKVNSCGAPRTSHLSDGRGVDACKTVMPLKEGWEKEISGEWSSEKSGVSAM